MAEMIPENVELVRILGAADSLFGVWPSPRDANAVCFAVNERQRNYLDGRGLPWTIGGDVAERKSGERILGVLETAGLVTLRKAARAHRHVGLTRKGDDHARSLCGFYRCPDCWGLFQGLAAAVEKGPGRYVNMSGLAATLDAERDSIIWGTIRPLLARGLLEAGASSIGETIFTVRDEQRKVASGDPPELLADPPRDERLNLIYWEAFDRAEAEKVGWKPSRPNCCYVSILN